MYDGGDRYDSDNSEEFFPNTSEEMDNMMWNQRRPDGGDNNSVNTVNMTPRCRTVLNGPRREVIKSTADEPSDTSKTDTADLDYRECQLETDVWDDMYCPVWTPGSHMVDSASQASQALSNKGEVACMSDFDDEDFNDTGFDSDVGSGIEFEWNTRDDAYTWESENSLPDPDTGFPAEPAKEVVCYRDNMKIPEEDACCTGIRSVNCVTRYIDSARYLVRLCLLGRPCRREVDVRCVNNVIDWCLEYSFTVAWCVNAADSSYKWIGRILTEFKGPRPGQILTGTITSDGRWCRYACLPPPGMFSAGRTLWPMIGLWPYEGGSAKHTAYIRQGLRVSQLVAAVPVTGSLVCISWLNLRDTIEIAIFPRMRTSGDTGWINRTVFQVWLQMIVGDCNMDAASSVTDDREGNTFDSNLLLPWDAPETIVNVSSAGVVIRHNLPDGMGLVGHK